MGYYPDMRGLPLQIELRRESVRVYNRAEEKRIWTWTLDGQSATGAFEITYEALADLLVSLTALPEVREKLDGRLDQPLKDALKTIGGAGRD